MDPLSALASVAGLITLVAETIKLSRNFIREARKSQDTAVAFVAELEILSSSLARLKAFLDEDPSRTRNFGQTSILMTRAKSTETKIRKLNQKMQHVLSSRIRQTLWPLSEKEHRESIQDLRNFSQWTSFCLSIDASALLSRSSEDIIKMLTSQLHVVRELELIDARTASIGDNIATQIDMMHTSEQAQLRKNVLAWLSNYDHEEKHRTIRAQRADGTGEWLLQDDTFREWYEDKKPATPILWCHGVPGSGKSVLASLVVDELRNKLPTKFPKAAFGYIYFDYKNGERISPAVVFSSLTRQILSRFTELPKSIIELYEQNTSSAHPDFETAWRLFLHTCAESSLTYIVLDALDECDEQTYRKQILYHMKRLKPLGDVRFFITSREYPLDIQEAFSYTSQIEIKAQTRDLKHFLSQAINDEPMAYMVDGDFRLRIIDKIADGAHGLFLLPKLQIQTILSAPTQGEMEEALETVPTDIFQIFDETIARIQCSPPGRKAIGMKALRWIFYAKAEQGLTITDLREALAVRPHQTLTDPRFRPSTEMILSCCSGLVILDKRNSRQPRFIHQVVQEYFQAQQNKIFPEGEDDLAETCLTYLLTFPFETELCKNDKVLDYKLDTNPFLRYASCHWGHHVQKTRDPRIVRLSLDLMNSSLIRSHIVQIIAVSRGRRYKYWSPEECQSSMPLHVVAHFGLQETARTMLENTNIDVNAATAIGTTPLMKAVSSKGKAALSGNEGVMRQLLAKGANPYKENWYGTSLHVAAEAGHTGAISILLETGMDVDIKNADGRRAIDCAMDMRRTSAVKLLLQRGADPVFDVEISEILKDYDIDEIPAQYANLRLEWVEPHRADEENRFVFVSDYARSLGGNAMHVAVMANDMAIAETMIRQGAYPGGRSRLNQCTPLHVAAWEGNVIAARMLLEAGADVHAICKDGHTPYWYAVLYEKLLMQHFLIAWGASQHDTPTQNEVCRRPKTPTW